MKICFDGWRRNIQEDVRTIEGIAINALQKTEQWEELSEEEQDEKLDDIKYPKRRIVGFLNDVNNILMTIFEAKPEELSEKVEKLKIFLCADKDPLTLREECTAIQWENKGEGK